MRKEKEKRDGSIFEENGEEVTRIISARRATKNERYQYETIKKR